MRAAHQTDVLEISICTPLPQGDPRERPSVIHRTQSSPFRLSFLEERTFMYVTQRRRGEARAFERQYLSTDNLMRYDGARTRVCLRSFCKKEKKITSLYEGHCVAS